MLTSGNRDFFLQNFTGKSYPNFLYKSKIIYTLYIHTKNFEATVSSEIRADSLAHLKTFGVMYAFSAIVNLMNELSFIL